MIAHLKTDRPIEDEPRRPIARSNYMDVTSISSFASSISSQKSAQASTEAQTRLIKKQSDQDAQVAGTIIQAATGGSTSERTGQGKLLAVA